MAYLTRADLESAYTHEAVAELLARVGIGPEASRLDTAFAATDGTINMALRGRYVVPFAGLPTELQSIARSIAWWELWRIASDKPDDVELRYKDAIAALTNLAKGITQLDESVPRPAAPTGTVSGGSVAAPARTMTYDSAWESQFTL